MRDFGILHDEMTRERRLLADVIAYLVSVGVAPSPGSLRRYRDLDRVSLETIRIWTATAWPTALLPAVTETARVLS